MDLVQLRPRLHHLHSGVQRTPVHCRQASVLQRIITKKIEQETTLTMLTSVPKLVPANLTLAPIVLALR